MISGCSVFFVPLYIHTSQLPCQQLSWHEQTMWCLLAVFRARSPDMVLKQVNTAKCDHRKSITVNYINYQCSLMQSNDCNSWMSWDGTCFWYPSWLNYAPVKCTGFRTIDALPHQTALFCLLHIVRMWTTLSFCSLAQLTAKLDNRGCRWPFEPKTLH